MPDVRIIEVSECLIASTPELYIETSGMLIPFESGLQLASRYAAGPGRGAIFDYLPESFFGRVANRRDFASMLAFDKWTGNCDGRQAVFTQQARQAQYYATFIDQGCCFNGSEWTFPDLPLHGVYYRNCVYHDVTGWDSFEPILSRIEQLDYAELWRCAAEIPHEWFEHDGEGLFSLIETLHERRFLVRDLTTGFRASSRHPFPQWTERTVLSVREAQAVFVQ